MAVDHALGASYTENQDFGTGMRVNSLCYDAKANRAIIVLEMWDDVGSQWLGKQVTMDVSDVAGSVTKLNGDVEAVADRFGDAGIGACVNIASIVAAVTSAVTDMTQGT